MRLLIPFSFSEIALRDIEFLFENCSDLHFDADKQAIVIENPSPLLLEELQNRGLEL